VSEGKPSTRGHDKPRGGILTHLRHRHDPLTSLVLTVPVFLIYHLGILVIDLRNGVDLVSTATFALLEQSVAAYIAVTLAIAAGLFGAGWWLRREGKIRPAKLLPVVGESVLWSVVMLLLLGWATNQIFAQQIGERALGPVEKIVMAAGAGFHEELIFRVGLFAGGTWLLSRAKKLGPTWAAVIAAIVSSLLFSTMHYVGALGDTISIVSFTFRVLAGLYLAALYRFRGFAVAVYTHAFYDVLVFFIV